MSYYRPGGSGQGSITTEPVQVTEGGTGATTAAGARTNLGLGSIATQAANNVAITGGTVSGITDIAVADGGTGASTAAAARSNLLPSYTGNANKVLSLNGTATDVEWTTNGAGTVTSVDMSVPTGLSVSGNPVTSSGTLAVTYAAGYAIPTTAKQTEWDTAYGWGNHASAGYLDSGDIGSTVQAYDSNLTSFVGTFTLPTTDGTNGQVLTTNGSGTIGFTTLSASGTVTSVDMTVPTGLAVANNPITTSGTLAITYASGYAIPTTAKQTEWDTAYGWGNHASAGYLTSAAIGTTVQGYDADTAKYDDVTANFTGTLQNGGNTVLTTASTISGGTY